MVLQSPQNRVNFKLPSKRKLLTLLSAQEHLPQSTAVNDTAARCLPLTETETAQLMPTANEVDVTYAEREFLNPDTRYRADAVAFLRDEIAEDPIVCNLLFDMASMNLHPSNAHRRDEAAIRLIRRLSYLVREQAAQDNLPRTQEVNV